VSNIKGQFFARDATGLVREIGLWDSFVLNHGFTGAVFSICLAWMVSQSLFVSPKGDFGVASLITFILIGVGVVLPYALFSMTMPRSGGDYVYVSRSLHPAVAFMGSLGIMLALSYFVAWGCYWEIGMVASNILGILGYTLDNQTLIGISEYLTSKTGLYIISAIAIIIFGLITVSGLRNFLLLIKASFIIGFIGMIVAIIYMLTTSPAEFARIFNTFMQNFTSDSNYYQTVIIQAKEAGFETGGGFSLIDTLKLLPIVAFSSLFAVGSAYVGGEVKNTQSTQLWGMLGALGFLAVGNAVIYWLTVKSVGAEFLGSINYLFYAGEPLELPLWPYVNLFSMLMPENIFMSLIIGIGFFAFSYYFIPMNMLLCTRMVFAWSFDRIFPVKFSEVSDRTHSPIWAVLLLVVLSEIFLAIYVFTPWLPTLESISISSVMILLVAISAIVFPYVKKTMFEMSPAYDFRLGNIPLMTISGIVGTLYMFYLLISYVTVPEYGASTSGGRLIILGIYVIALITFYGMRAWRKKNNVDIDLAYKEIPPE